MQKRETPKPKRVTRVGPVTGTQYKEIQKNLDLPLGLYLKRLGGNMRDHYQATRDPDQPIGDVTLALHLRLLDQYPELVEPEPTIDELLIKLRQITRDNPTLKLPMRITSTFLALLLGRNPRSSSMWNMGKAEPASKVSRLIKDLLLLLERHPDPAAFLQDYCDLVLIEAGTRGEHQLFTTKRWPLAPRKPSIQKQQGAAPPESLNEEAESDPQPATATPRKPSRRTKTGKTSPALETSARNDEDPSDQTNLSPFGVDLPNQ
ncbi:MAG: hypothetical protein WBQ05_07320 [Candidatus Competibacter denitrificans]